MFFQLSTKLKFFVGVRSSADKGVDYVVLNPGWFMQNFNEGSFARGIREKNAIFSASEDGKMAFIDARVSDCKTERPNTFSCCFC